MKKMNVKQLQQALGELKLTKSEIHLESNVPPTYPTTTSHHNVEYPWKVLETKTNPVDFSSNKSFTDPYGNTQNDKFNCSEKFERTKSKYASSSHERTSQRNALKKDSDGMTTLVTKVRTEGIPDLKQLDRMKLTLTLHPIEHVDAMMMAREIGTNGKRLSFRDEWTTHTNIKAIIIGFGEDVHSIYPDFVTFSTRELKQKI